ncbi:hypothetical protein [Acidilobus sp.]|uniref:hypothetical protein n=1 Tax=Acidilobus sp. TaxID=1872109 RepID=UPI003D010E4E
MPRLKLIAFVVRTRISRPLLIITLVMLFYGVMSGAYLYANHIELPPGEVAQERTMAVIYSAIVIFLASLQGGVTVIKSDRDYLFTLPISRGSLALSLYIGQMVLSGLLAVAWLGWYFPFIEVPLGYAAVDMVLFVLLLTSLTASIAELPAKRRVAVAAALAAWSISTLLRNPVSPSGVFNGYYLAGTATLAALSLGLTSYVATRLGRAPLLYGYSPVVSEGRGQVASSTLSFAGVRGLRAELRMKLNTLTITGRVGGFGAGGSRYFSRTVSVRRFMGYMSIAAAAYLAVGVALVALGLVPRAPGNGVLFGLLFVPAIAVEAFFIGSSASQVGNERPWLAFTAVDPGTYMWLGALSWSLVVFLASLPLAAAYVTLWLMGLREAVNMVPQLLLVGPAFSLLSYAASAYLAVSPQVRSEGFMPGQVRAKGLVITFIIIVPLALLSLAEASLSLSIYSGLASLLIAAPFMALRGFWRSASRRIVEAGYV